MRITARPLNLVVDATPDCDVEWRLRSALQLATEYRGELSAVCSAWPDGFSIAEVIAHSPIQASSQERELRSRIVATKAIFDRLAEESAVSTQWCESIADPGIAMRDHALFADLVVMGTSEASGCAHAPPIEVAGRSGAPVLRLGTAPVPTLFRSVLIAWKDRREARYALRAALPILQQSQRVVLVGVGEEAPFARLSVVLEYLSSYGIDALAMNVEDDGPVASVLAAIARREECQLVVAGARSRGRWKERIFGGVTQDLTATTDFHWLLAN